MVDNTNSKPSLFKEITALGGFVRPTITMKTKIYEIKLNDVKFWVCANTAIEAIKTYLATTDNDMVDLEDNDDIHEIPQEFWGRYTLVDTEAEMDEEGNYPVIMTFADYMEKEAMDSDIIATTAY